MLVNLWLTSLISSIACCCFFCSPVHAAWNSDRIAATTRFPSFLWLGSLATLLSLQLLLTLAPSVARRHNQDAILFVLSTLTIKTPYNQTWIKETVFFLYFFFIYFCNVFYCILLLNQLKIRHKLNCFFFTYVFVINYIKIRTHLYSVQWKHYCCIYIDYYH